MNHDVRLSIVMIHQATILHLKRILSLYQSQHEALTYGSNLRWSYISVDWVTIDEGW